MPRYQHLGRAPVIDASAWVAPTAVLCGDVRIDRDCAVCHGAVLDAGDGTIDIGAECIVMENAVLKASRRAPLHIGRNVLIGPRAYLTGCTVEDEVFLAAGSTVFNFATIGRRAEVRINGVVHIRTRVPSDATVPIGWVAVGIRRKFCPRTSMTASGPSKSRSIFRVWCSVSIVLPRESRSCRN